MKKVLLLLLLFVLSVKLFSQQDAWVYFTDKQNVSTSLANPMSILTQKAIDRKNLHGILIDDRDVPVTETYITQLKNATGITVMAKSKWFNAVHVRGSQLDIEVLANLSFVSSIDFANKSLNAKTKSIKELNQENNIYKLEKTFTTFNYGNALNQIEMFNGDDLHFANYTGTGVTVAVLDSGFPNVNTMTSFQRLRDAGNVLGSYDFVNRDVDVYTNTISSHGTWVLSDMAGYIEDQFVGTAPDASYYLFITEDGADENPVEESYWVEAAERADSLGVDIINTSLGYKDYSPNYTSYSYADEDMDGNTAYITRGANIAFEKGLLLVTSAGNSGNSGVGAPADSQYVLSIGAVNSLGSYASFSSVGSNIQPTLKPDVVAQGEASYIITEDDIIATADGTSFSSPILAGGIACLWEALPNKTNAEIMQMVRTSASQYNTPDYFLGYGIPDLQFALTLALSTDINKLENLVVFPNPTRGSIQTNLSSYENDITVKLFNVLGEEIYTFLISEHNNSINISSLSDGVYVLKFIVDNNSKSFKLVKN